MTHRNAVDAVLRHALGQVADVDPVRRSGRISRAVGLTVESHGPRVAVGEEVELQDERGAPLTLAEVVGFSGSSISAMPLDVTRGLRLGDRIVATGRHPRVPVGAALLGRVVDAVGRPLDGKGPLGCDGLRAIHGPALPALKRPRITEPMTTGVRAIDAFVTIGRGQRIGIFSGAGVGKSRLLGSIARHAADEVVVIALVGERNREVREFVEGELGPEGLARAVVFVATSDETPLRRVRCAFAATAVAESFRAHGKNVTLLMDSVTRVATALREIGLAAGEPPSTKGYTPSVFAALPRLMERAGREDSGGAVTGIYTVFVEGDDLNDPVSDAARAILDGHIVLARRLAERAHYPAVDVLASTSRVMNQVVGSAHLAAAQRVRRLMAIHRDNEDLIAIGAYRPGADPDLDAAVHWHPAIVNLLQQDLAIPSALPITLAQLAAIGAPADTPPEVS